MDLLKDLKKGSSLHCFAFSEKWTIEEKKFKINRFDETSQKNKVSLHFFKDKTLQKFME